MYWVSLNGHQGNTDSVSPLCILAINACQREMRVNFPIIHRGVPGALNCLCYASGNERLHNTFDVCWMYFVFTGISENNHGCGQILLKYPQVTPDYLKKKRIIISIYMLTGTITNIKVDSGRASSIYSRSHCQIIKYTNIHTFTHIHQHSNTVKSTLIILTRYFTTQIYRSQGFSLRSRMRS